MFLRCILIGRVTLFDLNVWTLIGAHPGQMESNTGHFSKVSSSRSSWTVNSQTNLVFRNISLWVQFLKSIKSFWSQLKRNTVLFLEKLRRNPTTKVIHFSFIFYPSSQSWFHSTPHLRLHTIKWSIFPCRSVPDLRISGFP